MSKIQILNYNKLRSNNSDVFINSFSNPKSPGLFDLTIIDLSHYEIWHSKTSDCSRLDIYKDFVNINKMMANNPDKKYVFIFPNNKLIKYYFLYDSYKSAVEIKNNPNLFIRLISEAFPILSIFEDNIIYEPNVCTINNETFELDFIFKGSEDYLESIKTDITEKSCFVQLKDNVFVTTLQYSELDSLIGILKASNVIADEADTPSWLNESYFLDDKDLHEKLSVKLESQKKLDLEINELNSKIANNNYYKKVLYTNGDELVSVVLEIMGEMLSFDYSSFVDTNSEDFNNDLDDFKLLGEIKGINTNVRREHVTQGLLHRERYFSHCEDNGLEYNEDKIISLLIINHQRSMPITERKEIDSLIVSHARNNKIIILETKTLLKIYYKYKTNELKTKDIKNLFILNKNGGVLNI